MKSKSSGTLLIAVSIGFAILILLSAWVMQGTEQKQTAVFLLIALWWIPFSYLSAKVDSGRKCCRAHQDEKGDTLNKVEDQNAAKGRVESKH